MCQARAVIAARELSEERAAERAHLASEVEWLLGTDSPDRIAVRLGYRNAKSLARVLSRHGRADLASHFYQGKDAA